MNKNRLKIREYRKLRNKRKTKIMEDNNIIDQRMYKLIINFVATQQYANELLNYLTDKIIQYWKKQKIAIEQKQDQWAKNSCLIYKKGIAKIKNLQVQQENELINLLNYRKWKLMLKTITIYKNYSQNRCPDLNWKLGRIP